MKRASTYLVLVWILCLVVVSTASAGTPDNKLIEAAKDGNMHNVRALLAKGADVNAKDNHQGATALMFAADYGHADVVRALLARGAHVNAKDSDGITALMFAAWKGHADIVRALLAKGADVNAKANNGRTASVVMVANGHMFVGRILLQKGEDEGATALDFAMLSGHAKANIEQILEAAGAKPPG